MPDFGALADLIGGITDILGAAEFFTGSLGGGNVDGFLGAIDSISAGGE
ncbi:hypothetical protein [Dietzia cinnamea]|nr:hypothetical protein [Dietzia cinnamea]MCT2119634.1 hypothetical protein [Dietzia cinnamea]MCT2138249.1 hypothetical protein [Dietzia cinnamea]MCT2143617.1 hypothetical protein [Dietzia cinnamea]MCT2263320.1 hypothetical protein [Dietzia cinnamea]MCT2303464.1 hypothetical protein [Dietzia cinnamea]